MPAGLASDGPDAPGIAGLRRQHVVLALAVSLTDRMDRREIHDVEAERGRPFQHRLGVLERSVATGHAGAREELVPGGEASALGVGDDVELALGPRRIAAIQVTAHQDAETFLARGVDGIGLATTVGETAR